MTCMWEQVEGGGGGYGIAVIVKKTCISGEGGGGYRKRTLHVWVVL